MAFVYMHTTGVTRRYAEIYAGEYATLYTPRHGFGPCPVSGDEAEHRTADRLSRVRADAYVVRRLAQRELTATRKAYDA
jgi:hypothetical protein